MRKKNPLTFPKQDRPTEIIEEIDSINPESKRDKERWNDLHFELVELCENDEELANSPRVAQKLIKFAYCLDDDKKINKLMKDFSEKGIGSRNPLWIASLALTYERVKEYVQAFNVYESNLEECVSKSAFAKSKYSDFKQRIEAKLRCNQTFNLGQLNGLRYTWNNGRIECRAPIGPVEPEIDILAILNFKSNESGYRSTQNKKEFDKPEYDPNLIAMHGSFIEARIAMIKEKSEKMDQDEEIKLPKKSPITRNNKRKPLAVLSRKESQPSSYFDDEEPAPILKKKKKISLNPPPDADDFFAPETEDEPKLKPKRKPLAPLSRSTITQDDEDDGAMPIPLKHRKMNPVPLITDEKPKSILRVPGSPRASPSRVRIASGGTPRRTSFAVGDVFSIGSCRMTVKSKKDEHSFICSVDTIPDEFILKITPAPSCLSRLKYKERFSLPDMRFDAYFVTLYIKYEFSSLIDIMFKKKTEELVVMFFLFELNRMLISLEDIKCSHGGICIENLAYSIPNGQLGSFNDNEDWKSTGLVLTNCDKVKESKGSDREDVKKIICYLINKDPANTSLPKVWEHKDFWNLAFKVLSNHSMQLNQIEIRANQILREKGAAIKSRISRLHIELQKQIE